LSPLFPLTFALFGFYTHTRSYSDKRKNRAIAMGVMVGAVLFFAVNQFVGNTVVGRSVAIPFVVLASFGLWISRFAQNYVGKRFDWTRKGPMVVGKKNQVLVVGGAGYIGSLLVEQLLNKGHKVRVLDALLYGREALRTVESHPDFQLMVGDCRNMQDVVRAVR